MYLLNSKFTFHCLLCKSWNGPVIYLTFAVVMMLSFATRRSWNRNYERNKLFFLFSALSVWFFTWLSVVCEWCKVGGRYQWTLPSLSINSSWQLPTWDWVICHKWIIIKAYECASGWFPALSYQQPKEVFYLPALTRIFSSIPWRGFSYLPNN